MTEGLIKPNINVAPPLEYYESLIITGELKPDSLQELGAKKLQNIYDKLDGYRPKQNKRLEVWKNLFRLVQPDSDTPRGLYIHGPVGRGKSMLMDLFYNSSNVKQKRRVHFHAFMLEVQQRLTKERRTKKRQDPLMAVASDIADNTWLMCFDEFHVVNIADAMILSRLFQRLFERGVIVIATSNTSPQELYKDGLQRDRFLPFINLICKHLDIFDINRGLDFRLDRLKGLPVYYTPLGKSSTQKLNIAFETLTDNNPTKEVELSVLGRKIFVSKAAHGVARFSFDELCRTPRSAADFLTIANRFHTVMIDGIPKLNADEREVAKRFVVLIDSLYEKKVNLFASAEVGPSTIYSSGDITFEFQRTVSRLIEMQAEDYIASNHLPSSGDNEGL